MKVDMEKLYFYAVGVVLVLGLVMPFDANAGNVQWSIQMHFPITGHSHGHNPAHGTIETVAPVRPIRESDMNPSTSSRNGLLFSSSARRDSYGLID